MKMSSEFILKKNALQYFCDLHSHRAKQGTKAWKESRLYTIGGSEMSTLLGMNQYNSRKKLLQSKFGFSTFTSSDATRWGNFFEPCGQMLLEKLFDCVIYETGCLPGSVPNTSYSPDGMSIIKRETIDKLIADKILPEHKLPENSVAALFEIKSPYSRIPTDKIPEEYKAQPQCGLNYFDFLDIAYFINIMYRICTLADLKTGNYYSNYSQKEEKSDFTKTIHFGIVGVYQKLGEFDLLNYDPKKKPKEDDELRAVDLVEDDPESINRIIRNVHDKFYEAIYFDVDEDVEISIAKYRAICDKNMFINIGIIPYKILRYELIPVEKEPGFIEKIKPVVEEFMELMDKIRKMDNDIERMEFINAFKEPRKSKK